MYRLICSGSPVIYKLWQGSVIINKGLFLSFTSWTLTVGWPSVVRHLVSASTVPTPGSCVQRGGRGGWATERGLRGGEGTSCIRSRTQAGGPWGGMAAEPLVEA